MSLLAASFQPPLLVWIGAGGGVALTAGSAALLMLPLPWTLGGAWRPGFSLSRALIGACLWWVCFQLAALELLVKAAALLRLEAVPAARALPLLLATTALLSALAPAAAGAVTAARLQRSQDRATRQGQSRC